MTIHDYPGKMLWLDFLAASLCPIDLSEIIDLFAVVMRGAASTEAAHRLGPAHVVVRLAAAVVSGQCIMAPDQSAFVVVIGAYLAEPPLSERWFGCSLNGPEQDAFVQLAAGALAAEIEAFTTCEAGQ